MYACGNREHSDRIWKEAGFGERRSGRNSFDLAGRDGAIKLLSSLMDSESWEVV